MASIALLRRGGRRLLASSCVLRRRATTFTVTGNRVPRQFAAQFQLIHSQVQPQEQDDKVSTEVSTTNTETTPAEESSSTTPLWVSSSEHPNYKLNLYYKTNHPDCILDADACYTRTLSRLSNRSWWTVTFTCPVSGRTFPAGTLPGVEPRMHIGSIVHYQKVKHAISAASARALDCIYFEETGIATPRLCLEEPIILEVEPAAATTQGEEEGADESSSDEEMESDVELETDDNIHDEPPPVLISSSPHGPNEVEMFGSDETMPPPPRSIPRLGVTTYDLENVEDNNEQEEEEYTLQHMSTEKTAMDRVLKAWAKSVQTHPATTKQDDDLSWSTLPLSRDDASYPYSEQQHQAIIDGALAWYRTAKGINNNKNDTKKKKNTFAKSLFQPFPQKDLVTVDAAISVLGALANINAQQQQSLAMKASVEPLAKGIVKLLHEHKECQLTADVYNVYMKCFSGTDEEVARRADVLLTKMLDGNNNRALYQQQQDEVLLPKPNVETYNTVIQLWGRVGRQIGRDFIRKNYNSLTRDVDSNTKEIVIKDGLLIPNRETFLSIMACWTNGCKTGEPHDVPTLFSNDAHSKRWIERAKRYSQRFQDETLQPDTVMYNAHLRRASGIHDVPPWSRHIPWDRHDVIFAKGFREQQQQHMYDGLTIEARRMAEWMDDMETSHESNVSPNIETYESVIQAWVRTGTLDGLLQAEALAMRLIASQLVAPTTIVPRLQTFHPILAAWAYSGHETGPQKVAEWIQRLQEQSKTTQQVSPDGRVKALPITAWRTRIQRLVEAAREESRISRSDVDGSDSNNEIDAIVGAAQSCSSELESLCNSLRQVRLEQSRPEFFVESSAFEDAIQAWGHVASFLFSPTLQQKQGFSHHHATAEILHIVRQFDETIDFYESFQGTDTDTGWHSRQLNHLLHNAPNVYNTAIGIFNEIDSNAPKHPDVDPLKQPIEKQMLFARNLSWVETMVRKSVIHHHTLLERRDALRSSEFSRKDYSGISSNSKYPEEDDDSTVVYADLYNYHSEKANLSLTSQSVPAILDLFQQVVIGCKCLSPEFEAGDAVRLCMLILDFLKGYSPSEPRLMEVEATELYCSMSSVIASKVSPPLQRAALIEHVRSHVSSLDNIKEGKRPSSKTEGSKGGKEEEADDNTASRKLVVVKSKVFSHLDAVLEYYKKVDRNNRGSGVISKKPKRASGKRRRTRGKRKHQKKNHQKKN